MNEYQILKNLIDTPAGAELKGFLETSILSLDSIRAIPQNLTQEEYAKEARARERALEILLEVLRPILDLEENKGRPKKKNEQTEMLR